MSKIRVMQLIAPLSMAGAERVVQTMARNLDSERFENSICTFVNHRRSTNSFTEAIQKQGLRLDKILLRRHLEWQPVRDLVNLARFRKIDIFHSHGYRADVMGIIASRFLGIPTVSTVHGWNASRSKWSLSEYKMLFYDKLDLFALRRFDRIIAVSENTARALETKIEVAEKLEVIPNTLDPAGYDIDPERMRIRDRLGIDPSTKVVGFLGRFSREKGLFQLLDAVPTILEKMPNCRFLLAGGGPLARVLRERCSVLGVSDKVHVLDEINYVCGFYESLDLFVLPSLTEGMPMALLEAQFFGLPIIASRVGGIPEIIAPGENGLLVEPDDTGGLARSITKILENDSLARSMGKVNHLRFKGNNHVRKWASRYESIYSSLVKGK